MPQIIFTDTVIGEDGLPLNNTPGAQYAAADIETILECIARGEIQCGTGENFPVDWPNDTGSDTVPWFTNGPQSSGPWKKY